MSRSEKKSRRLVVDDKTFLWWVTHRHRAEEGRFLDCCEILDIRPFGERGRLLITFQDGPGRLVPDGYMPSGSVGKARGADLNLHEPGTVRALLDEAGADGWDTDDPQVRTVDGWAFFDAVAARRGGG
ncbi:hypothetical protein J7I98_19590 [Streptomyces sp. ISL-98]|uniref:hypothetical protein n=1 Tax=Streptomyces sp. ISL-98 TaxID=2819192 RepID=UPI001BECB087|nr:hypothetical protein [Streptomyces sp. ISL-98]MBT2508048.1 hypothetical protein [Streptomyces sp. ISL-98]